MVGPGEQCRCRRLITFVVAFLDEGHEVLGCMGGGPMKEVIASCVTAGMWVLKLQQAELIGSALCKGVDMYACFVQCVVQSY